VIRAHAPTAGDVEDAVVPLDAEQVDGFAEQAELRVGEAVA
jgi:hypothetical protein